MAEEEQEKKQQNPVQTASDTSQDLIRMGMKMKGKGAVARVGAQLAARAAVALAPAIAAAAPFLLIAIAIIAAVLIFVLFIVIILVAIGVIGGGGSSAYAFGSGLGVKENYCQSFERQEDYDGDGVNDCSLELKRIILAAAGWAKMPAGVLLGIGLSENLGDVMDLSDVDIIRYSGPGASLPPSLCAISSARAVGPMQFMPGTWDGGGSFPVRYKDAVNIATSDNRIPNRCNIKDSIYAAAWKLKCDVTPLDRRQECLDGDFREYDYNDSTDAWEKDEEVFPAARAYLNACVVGGITYCENVWELYNNKKDAGVGVTDLVAVPCGWPTKGFISSVFGSAHPRGIDIAALGSDVADGQAVFNTMTGTVTRAEWRGVDRGGGRIYVTNTVGGIIYRVAYVHMDQSAIDLIQPRLGQILNRGEFLGRTVVGITIIQGVWTGVHLHYEIYENGSIVDPMSRFTPQRLNWGDTVQSPGGCTDTGTAGVNDTSSGRAFATAHGFTPVPGNVKPDILNQFGGPSF